MRRHRTWFSLLSYCVLTALAAAFALALIVAGGSVALASHQSADAEEAQSLDQATPQVGTTFTGMITDSHCGARHMRKSNLTSVECARACYRKGASYLLIDGSRRFTLLGGESAVDKVVGQRANVIGNRQGDKIIVDSATPTF